MTCNERHVYAEQACHVGCDLVIERKPHRSPGNRVGREYRSHNQLVGAAINQSVKPHELAVGIVRNQGLQIRLSASGQRRESTRHYAALRIEHDQHISADSSAIIGHSRHQGGGVCRGDCLLEAEVRGQYLDGAGELIAPEFEDLTGRICRGPEPLRGLASDLSVCLAYHGDHRRGYDHGDETEY